MTFQDALIQSLEVHGDRTAIEQGDKAISYAALLAGANRITSFLLHQKLDRETIIGVQMTDRVDLIYAMIGVMNAGCIFAPLDGSLPPARREAIRKELDLKYLLVPGRESEETALTPYFLADILTAEEAGANPPPSPRYNDEDSLYVYFTSGSTGTPKGIVGKNRSLLQFLQWETGAFHLNSDARVSQLISPYFDAFLRDVFVPLLAGGTLCIPPAEEDFFTPEKLVAWIEASRVNLIHCVPSLFRVFNGDWLTPHHFKHLKYILLSGERINPAELTNWYSRFGDRIQLVNLYGPTEGTMIRTCYLIRPEDATAARIPIGFPIRDTELLILDDAMNPCGTLIAGDLYIVSEYMTKGYLNNPALTHEKFIRLNAGSAQEKRAFRTGDKARTLVDGRVDLLGREDRQVKLNGVRLELDEIESILLRSGLVKNAVVVKHTEDNKEEALLAFVIAADGAAENIPLPVALQEHLKVHLPHYLVPAHVIAVPEYPLLGNGKIDYKGLLGCLQSQREIVPPANETEAMVLSIWKGILGDKVISTEDHFHQIGGNSLKMMNLINKIHKACDVRIALSALFKHSTVRKQAEMIEQAKRASLAEMPASGDDEATGSVALLA